MKMYMYTTGTTNIVVYNGITFGAGSRDRNIVTVVQDKTIVLHIVLTEISFSIYDGSE